MSNDNLLDEEGENQAVRDFLGLYGCAGGTNIGTMKKHMKRSGWDKHWPDWVENERDVYPVTKSGAQLWIRHLFSMEPAPAHCSEGDRCVCGGDLPRIREGCGNWIKRGQK